MFGHTGKEIILVGEAHNSTRHDRAERDIFIEYEPCYILHEGLHDKGPDFSERKIEQYSQFRTYELILNHLNREERKYIGKVMKEVAGHKKTREAIVNGRPIVDWSTTLRNNWKKELKNLKDVSGGSVNLKFDIANDLRKILKNIGRKRGYYYLIDGVAALRNAGEECYLAGNDVSESRKRDIKEKLKKSPESYTDSKDERDKMMAKRTINYREKANSSGPVVSVVGLGHYEEISEKLKSTDYKVGGIDLSEHVEVSKL